MIVTTAKKGLSALQKDRMDSLVIPKYADTKFSRQMCRAYTDKSLCEECINRFMCYTEK